MEPRPDACGFWVLCMKGMSTFRIYEYEEVNSCMHLTQIHVIGMGRHKKKACKILNIKNELHEALNMFDSSCNVNDMICLYGLCAS